MDSVIVSLDDLDSAEIAPLLQESLSEGYSFVQTLLNEYETGKNRFDTPGAALIGVYQDDKLIGIGGVHQDPYLRRADVGRVRHVYVLKDYRRRGIGKQLLDALIQHARTHFDLLTLRTPTQAAADFYSAIGFDSSSPPQEATHWLRLNLRSEE